MYDSKKTICGHFNCFLCLLWSCFATDTSTSEATAVETLLINEVMFHPLENENTNEWIELYNPTSEPLDVAGWMIADEKETDSILADTENGDGTTIIPPGGYAIITDKGTTIYETYTIPDNAIRLSVDDSTLCGYGLNNQQEKIILFDLDSSLIDAVEWGEDFEDVPGSPFRYCFGRKHAGAISRNRYG